MPTIPMSHWLALKKFSADVPEDAKVVRGYVHMDGANSMLKPQSIDVDMPPMPTKRDWVLMGRGDVPSLASRIKDIANVVGIYPWQEQQKVLLQSIAISPIYKASHFSSLFPALMKMLDAMEQYALHWEWFMWH